MEFFDRFAIPHPSPAIYASMVAIGLTVIAIFAGLTYFKKWGYLWREWLTTVDHKRIGIMYLIICFAHVIPRWRRCNYAACSTCRTRWQVASMLSTIMKFSQRTGSL